MRLIPDLRSLDLFDFRSKVKRITGLFLFVLFVTTATYSKKGGACVYVQRRTHASSAGRHFRVLFFGAKKKEFRWTVYGSSNAFLQQEGLSETH